MQSSFSACVRNVVCLCDRLRSASIDVVRGHYIRMLVKYVQRDPYNKQSFIISHNIQVEQMLA